MELTQDLIAASLQYNVSNSQQLLLRKKNIISIANNFCLEEILLLDLSDNRIETIHNIFEQFPSAWWIYLSNNKIKSLELKNLPNAIGTLNLRNNQLESMESLKELSNLYIMRLYIDEFKDGKEIINSSVLAYLPNLWVLNDDFITSKEIESVSKSSADTFTLPGIKPKNNNKFQSGNFYYGSANPHEKQSTFIVMVNDIPKNPSLVDAYKLDILLDDYLYEACVHNVKCPPKMRIPFFDISKILLLPHRMRLDLSVMLTAEILIFIPRDLLIECLAQLLQPSNISRSEIVSLLQLPGYTKTAIINIIRRIAKKELDELSQNKIIVSKEKFISVDEYIKPDHDGYRFVKSIHAYLRSDIPTIVVKAADISRSHEYSEMELEFLSKLPDVITRSTCPSKEDAGYNSWVSLAARHTVVLLTRVPSCPSLLKSHKTKKEQDLYCLMLPLLDAAAMTHRDLRIAMTGEEIDGRSQLPSSDHHKMPSNIRDTKSLLELRKMNTGAVIPYGAGMPKGSAEKLSWNTKEVRRNYYKPWQSEESESLSSGSRSKLVSHVPTVVLEPESIYSSLLKIKQESVKEEPIQDSELTTLNGEEYEEEEHERTKITEEDFNKLCLIEESKTKSFGSLELTNLMKSSTQQLEPWKNYNWREIEEMLSTTSSGNINIKHAPSSKIRVSTVAGFSHDIESTPAFCLAPQKTVDLINTAICTSEEAQWHDINRAPVIVHPLSTVQFPLALAEESQRRTMSRQPSHEPTGSSSLEDMQPQSQQTDFIPSEMTAEVAAGRDEFDFVIQELQEVERHSSFLATNLGAKRIGSSEDWLKSFTNNLNDMSKPEEDHEMQNLLYKIEEVGNRLTKHEDVEEDAESIKSKAKSIADSTSASSRRLRAREIDPALALLTEMGTLRNTRILHEKNKSSAKALSQYKKKMTKQLISPLKRVKSYDTASDAGLFSPDKSKIKSKKQEELLRFSWNSFLQTPFPNNTNHLSDQPIFLTAENGVDEEETGFIQPLSPQFMQLTNQLELDIAEHSAMNKTSLTQQLRQTVKYNRIYSNKNDVEFGYVSSGGCKVSKSWYPCYPKQVYTLNPNEFDNRVLIKHSQSQKIFKSNFQLNQQSDYKIKKAVAPKLLPLYKLPVVPSIHYGVSRSASVVSKTQLENLTYDESNDMKQEMTDTITAENTATIEMNSALQLDFFQNSASNRSVAYTPGSSIAIEVPLSAVKIEPPVQQTYRTVPTPRGLVVRLETDTQSITDSPMKSGPNSPAKPKATSPSKSIIQSRTNSGSNLLEIKGTGTFL